MNQDSNQVERTKVCQVVQAADFAIVSIEVGTGISWSAGMSLNHEKLSAVAQRMMTGSMVSVASKTVKVERTGSQKLRTVRVEVDGREYQMIEQNPEKPSRWGKLARDGRQVVQVRDVELGKYVAAVVDGKVREYGRLKRRDSAE